MVKPKHNRARVSLSVVGCGRLGTALALALAEVGYETVAIVCRGRPSAKRAAAFIAGARALTADRLNELPPTKLVLIATPDDAISETVNTLASIRPEYEGVTVLHTSGALSSTVLSPLKQRGAQTGSLHPLVSVSNPLESLQSLRTAFYCIEGDRQATAVAKKIVRALGGHSFSVSSSKKPLYHAAAVMSAGHIVALFDTASEMLSRCGLKRSEAELVLLPLVRSTVANLERSSISKALTGTFSRGDLATVKEHIDAMKKEDLQEALSIYRLLGQRSLQISSAVKNNPELLRDLQRLLRDMNSPKESAARQKV